MTSDPGSVRSSPATTPSADDEPALSVGEKLGRYELLGRLGAGGMSVVYLAHDPELDRRVALKLMRTRAVGPDGARRLQREAQALARLSHPNVVPVYDVGAAAGQVFVAMEHVEGQTLRAWMRGARAWRDVTRVMLDAGRGLAAAHAAGLVHRDFKPDNVLIGSDGRVRVLDFGLARLASMLDGTEPASRPSLPPDSSGRLSSPPLRVDSSGPMSTSPSSHPTPFPSSSGANPIVQLTRADQIVGTPAYMAPEQIARGVVDERADQFSFAVTFYEALFKQRPFDDLDPLVAGSTAATVTTDVTSLRRAGKPRVPKRGGAPGYVVRAVLRALSYAPEDRFPSMNALLEAVGRDPYRKYRRAAVVVGTAALAIAAGVGLARSTAKETKAPLLCRGGAARVESTWSAATKDEVRRAFEATGVGYAGATFATVGGALDAYARQIADATDDACAATRLRGEQSEEVLDLRTACTATRLAEMRALVDAFRHADVETVKQGAKAARALAPVSECADIAALRAPSPLPKDRATAERVERAESELATVQASIALGKDNAALEQSTQAMQDANESGFAPIVARAHYWRGRAAANLNESATSIPELRAAFAAALTSNEGRVLKESSARLAQEYIYTYDLAQFATWSELAQAAIDRGTPDAAAQSFLDHARCVAMWQPGKTTSRLACLEAHAARVERTRALDDWELTTLGLAAADSGELARGVEYTRRGYAYALAENGPLHPRTLEMRGFVCKALLDYGDIDAAVAECTEAVRAAEAAGDENAFVVGKTRMFWGAALREVGRFDEARKQLELAKSHADASELGGEIALLELASGHAKDAVAVLREALADASKDLPPVHSNVIVSKLQLGEALLALGHLADARALLDDALATCANAEVSPVTLAETQMAAARVRYRDPKRRAEALDLARDARATYEKSAPHTERYDRARARIDAWLAAPK